jgi:16S rRNA (cytidine1402-2'-O)-methyltransferase
MFAGFLPAKDAARRADIAALKSVPATLVFFESGARLRDTLQALLEELGPREATVARELTKFFEEFRHGTLSGLAEALANEPAPRGEIVLLVGPPQNTQPENRDVEAALRLALTESSVKEASQLVSEAFGLPRKAVYALALRLKDEG